MMEKSSHDHYQLSDDEFETGFARQTFDPGLFSHEAHLRLAWIHLSKYGPVAAEENICSQLIAYTQKLGASDKFHRTVTCAAIKAVHHFMQRSDAQTFAAFIAAFPRLRSHFKELLAQHYSTDIFCDDSARAVYREPDLLPF